MAEPYVPPQRPDGAVNFNMVDIEDVAKIPRAEFLKVNPNFDRLDEKGNWRDKDGKQIPTPVLKSTKLKKPFNDKTT